MKKSITVTLAFVLTLASLLTLAFPSKPNPRISSFPENNPAIQDAVNPIPTPTPSQAPMAITNSSQQQETAPQQDVQLSRSPQLPSTFTIIATIVSLVAVFGTILSLFLRRRNKSQNKLPAKTSGERFWAIDCYGPKRNENSIKK